MRKKSRRSFFRLDTVITSTSTSAVINSQKEKKIFQKRLRTSGSHAGQHEQIAGVADRLDQMPSRTLAQLPPNLRDVHVDGAVEGRELFSHHRFGKLVAADHASGILEQVPQDVVLERRQ